MAGMVLGAGPEETKTPCWFRAPRCVSELSMGVHKVPCTLLVHTAQPSAQLRPSSRADCVRTRVCLQNGAVLPTRASHTRTSDHSLLAREANSPHCRNAV